MKNSFYLVLLLVLIIFCSSEKQTKVPDSSLQLILAISDSADANKGVLFTYERENSDSPWREILKSVPAVFGRNGLALGRGLHVEEKMSGLVQKMEGDGRSPAGMFAVGEVFGYAPNDSVNMPYLLLEDLTECVDDKKSNHYNQILKARELPNGEEKDWNSSEKMREMGVVYEQGLVILHNQNPIEKGSGSCIFLHNWRAPESTTSGCTAIDSETLTGLINWLSVQRNPTFILLPKQNYLEVKGSWELP